MKNERGSTIVTAVVVGMILTILVVACFAIASSYHMRSLKNHQERQAYLTARAIVDTISTQIQAGNAEFIPHENTPIHFPDIQLTNDTCDERKATITLERSDIIVIVGTATHFGKIQEIQLTMQKDSTTNQWQNSQYSHKGESAYEME